MCELMQALGDSQPKISRHLAQLRNCGILDDTRRGQWVFYSMAVSLPDWASDVLRCAMTASEEAVSQFQKNLKSMNSRPLCC